MEKEDLENTFIEEYSGGLEEFEKERFRNSIILLSKSTFAICDILIYSKLGKLPKNHTERFQILQKYFPNVYPKIDQIFNEYRNAYSKPILKNTCEKIKNEIKEIVTNNELPREIKELIE